MRRSYAGIAPNEPVFVEEPAWPCAGLGVEQAQLETLVLAENGLSGISRQIRRLQALRMPDLGHNRLTGVPDSPGDLNSLTGYLQDIPLASLFWSANWKVSPQQGLSSHGRINPVKSQSGNLGGSVAAGLVHAERGLPHEPACWISSCKRFKLPRRWIVPTRHTAHRHRAHHEESADPSY